MRATFALAIGVSAAALLSGCARKSCLRGDCEEVGACRRLEFTCDPPGALYAGRVGDADVALRLTRGQGADDDLLLSNGLVTVVIGAIDAPQDLAPTGGNLIDLGPVGGADDLNIVYQIAGILPDDAFAYESLEIVEETDHVAAVARGHLDGRPEVDVVTRYELGPCDPGVRVRTELFNGSPDVQAWVIADVPHWGKRRVVPFAPAPGEGYLQPELELLELDSLYEVFDYGAGAATAPDSPSYAAAACNQSTLEGINDLELSALGTPRPRVRPGDTVVLERFWATAGAGQGAAPAIATAITVRSLLLGAPVPVFVSGRVVADGVGFGGDVRRADIVISAVAGDVSTPVTSVVPGADGTFAAAVPSGGTYAYEVSSFGRVVSSGDVPVDGAIGDVDVAAPAILQVTIEDGATPWYGQVVLVPADQATYDEVRGTFHGRFDECAPWLGPPHGSSPACNRFLVEPTGGEAEVPAGRYDVYATAGPDYTLGRAEGVVLTAGEVATLDFALERLDVVPAGWLRADLHVHGRASFDSAIPDRDRVLSFVAAGIEVIAATDHDQVVDYADQVTALGVGTEVRVMGGVETTQLIPWMEVPDDGIPRVIGHFNFWPIAPMPTETRGGAPWDELVEPGELFDRMEPLVGADGVMMHNHPWDEPVSGRDLGYLRAIKYDPRIAIPAAADGTRNGLLLRAPGGGHRNLDWDVIEVQNGAGIDEFVKTRALWWGLLSQGFVAAGAANSDSHGLTDAHLGWGRNLVDTGGDLAGFDDVTFDRAVRGGKIVGGSGIWIGLTITNAAGVEQRGLGFEPYVPAAGDLVHVEVRAAPWIPVTELRAVNSSGVSVIATDLLQPADPLGAAGVVRYTADFAVADLVGAGDDWFLLEAGLPLPEYEDLDDDGVPDTGDNNGDGRVDEADVEEDEDSGPLRNPPDPAFDARTDPRYLLTRVVPQGFPVAFTSPLLVDRDGDGWDPPGLP
jgi:hypothetical protein